MAKALLPAIIQGIPFWLFVAGVAGVLVVSFCALALAGPRAAAATGGYATWDLLRLRPVRRVLGWRPLRFLLQGSSWRCSA